MTDFYAAMTAMMPDSVRTSIYSADLPTNPTVQHFPYAVFWGTQPTELSGRDRFSKTLSDRPVKEVLEVKVTYAALNPESLRIVMRNVRRALAAGPPVVDGYKCHLTRPVSLQPVQVDRDITVGSLHPLYAIDEMTLTAHFTGDPNAR